MFSSAAHKVGPVSAASDTLVQQAVEMLLLLLLPQEGSALQQRPAVESCNLGLKAARFAYQSPTERPQCCLAAAFSG
jgi:hypothetical protein